MEDLNEIKIFIQVVTRGSFTLAAEFLGLTKSTVSRKVAMLESRLGVRLLTRTTRQLYLTEEGEDFYKRCERILRDLEEAELAVSSAQEKVAGHLKIILPIELGQLVMGRVIGEYLQRYPGVTIEAELTNRKIDMLEEGVDLMFRLGLDKDSSLISRRLTSAHPVLVASPQYIERRGLPNTPSDLERHECIVSYMPTWTFYKEGMEKTVKPSGAMKSNNITCTREAAIAGLGITLIPSFLVEDIIAKGELIRIMEDWQGQSRHIYALYPSRQYKPQKLKTFLSFAIKKLREHKLFAGSA